MEEIQKVHKIPGRTGKVARPCTTCGLGFEINEEFIRVVLMIRKKKNFGLRGVFDTKCVERHHVRCYNGGMYIGGDKKEESDKE